MENMSKTHFSNNKHNTRWYQWNLTTDCPILRLLETFVAECKYEADVCVKCAWCNEYITWKSSDRREKEREREWWFNASISLSPVIWFSRFSFFYIYIFFFCRRNNNTVDPETRAVCTEECIAWKPCCLQQFIHRLRFQSDGPWIMIYSWCKRSRMTALSSTKHSAWSVLARDVWRRWAWSCRTAQAPSSFTVTVLMNIVC